MSSFSSILASLGDKSQASKPANGQQPVPAKKPISPAAAVIGNEKQTFVINNEAKEPAVLKRKAEDISGGPTVKSFPHGPTPPMRNPITKKESAIPSKPGDAVKDKKTQGFSSNTQASATSQNQRPPPKGSFREIMARAEAAKQKHNDFGQIKHKPVEKLSRKERLRREEEAKAAAKASARLKPASSAGPIGAKGKSQAGSEAASSPKKKPVDLGYSGTMRSAPSQPTYKGTMNPSGASRSKTDAGKPLPKTSNGSRYVYAEDFDSEESEDESDMEAAGFDELEEEEQRSLRVAKKEDEEALRQEEEHRRQKAERKRKLEQLSASRKR